MKIFHGVDIVNIKRFDIVLTNYGDRFLNRIFCKGTQAYCEERQYTTLCLAARFSAKEAAIKACTPFAELTFKDFEIRKMGDKPTICFVGTEEIPPGEFTLSISHNEMFAIATVIYTLT